MTLHQLLLHTYQSVVTKSVPHTPLQPTAALWTASAPDHLIANLQKCSGGHLPECPDYCSPGT